MDSNNVRREMEIEEKTKAYKAMSKKEKIDYFAKCYDLEKYHDVPEGWVIQKNSATPEGSVLINNRKSIASGQRKRGLLILPNFSKKDKNLN